MAHIEKLLLRGLRSFGPNDEDEAKLKFSTPLTIILGQNGCGKTTIIEALKYATCGDMPGNCQQGAGFVHDPKISNCTEVRAQVKLQIRDIKGKPVNVSRCMQTIQKAKKLNFKTLDQTITRKDQAGQDVSISGRCADIDAEMCVAMGVSKPILNYVIFCHQEDSNWPLDEGKKLKERFDSIFDTAKYNKCLDYIKLQRKTIDERLKLKNKDLDLFKGLRNEAAEKRTKLTEEESRMAVIQDKVAEYENELEPIKRKLSELLAREDDISSLITERAKKNATLEAIQSNIREYQQSITSEFQGSVEELKQAILDFKSQSSQQESCLEALEGEVNQAQLEETRLTKKLTSEQVQMGQLSRDQEKQMEHIEQRNQSLAQLCNQLQLNSDVLSEGDVVRSLGSVERSIREAETRIENLRETTDKEEKSLQEKIDNIREEKTKLEQTLHLKNQQMSSNREETKKCKLEIEEVNQSTDKLNRLSKQLEKVQKATEDLRNAVDSNQLDEDIREAETQRDKFEDDLAILDKEVRELQSVSHLMTEINVLQETKTTKESDIRKLKNRTEDSLRHLLGNIPETGIKQQLQTRINSLVQTLRATQSKVNEKQKQLTMLESDHKHKMEKLEEKALNLQQDKKKLYDECESQDYETVLDKVTDDLDKAQDERGTCKASEFMYRRYVDKLKKDRPCCPLCNRGFQDLQEAQELIIELEGKMENLPSELEENERELIQLQERQRRLQQLKPTYDRIGLLEREEIPTLKTELSTLESKVGKTRQELISLTNDLKVSQSDESMAKSIQGDVALLDQHQTELRKLEREVSKLQEKLPQGGSKRNLQDAIKEQDKIRKEMQSLRKRLQSLQDKRNRHNQQIHQLQTEKNSIVEQQLKIQGGVQQKKQLEDKMADLQVQEIVLMEEYNDIQEQLQPMNEKLEAAIGEKERARLSHKQTLDKERNKVNNLTKQYDEIRKLQEVITKYEKSGGAGKLATVKQTIARLSADKESLVERKKQLLEEIIKVKAQLNNQQVRARELDDNMKLRQKREEENNIRREISELSAKIGGMDLKRIMKEKTELKKREETILKDKSHTEGRKWELQDNIQYLRLELSKDKYKTADKKYSDCLIEVKVESTASQDLNHYGKALDWAVSHFHNERMKHINDIIGDLWTQIYCGNDIDTIKIKNDEDIPTGDSKRKTYNYRVVQVKNGQELDMRGRCSAGQKMLASLIIRLALAEIFSTKCGILTLDEPTTNLDKENIDRLCSALANLISVRANHKSNFQLIIITHDEEFIDKLTKMHKVDYYFAVSRNHKGKSTVSMVRSG